MYDLNYFIIFWTLKKPALMDAIRTMHKSKHEGLKCLQCAQFFIVYNKYSDSKVSCFGLPGASWDTANTLILQMIKLNHRDAKHLA